MGEGSGAGPLARSVVGSLTIAHAGQENQYHGLHQPLRGSSSREGGGGFLLAASERSRDEQVGATFYFTVRVTVSRTTQQLLVSHESAGTGSQP